MGTRSLTVFLDSDNTEIAVMYRQMDGYPSGHGQELADFLAGMVMVNGLSSDSDKVANGCGCLAAQVVAEFKDEPGDIYLYPGDTRNMGEDYIYFVTGKYGEEPTIKCMDPDVVIYDGPASVFNGEEIERDED